MSPPLKRRVLLSSTLAFASLGGTLDASASLIAFYDFENDTQDVSGNGQHGTPVGTEQYSTDIPATLAGRSTASYNFDAAESYVSLPPAVSVATLARSGGATLSFWFRTSQANTGYLFSEGSSTSSTPIYGLQVGNTASPDLRFQHRTSSTPTNTGTSEADVVDDTWRHVALVADGNAVKLYLNGILDAGFASYTHPDVAFDGNIVSLGALVRNTISFRTIARMDEVSIFDTVLTPAELTSLAAGVSPTAIPEPASLALLGVGLAFVVSRQRKDTETC